MNTREKIKLTIAIVLTFLFFFFDFWLDLGIVVVRPGVFIVALLFISIITSLEKKLKEKE